MGDPAGCGPEVVCGGLARLSPAQRAATVVIGHIGTLRRADQVCRTGLAFTLEAQEAARAGDNRPVLVFEVPTPGIEDVAPGVVSAAGGTAAYAYVARSVGLSLEGRISTIVTAPLNKAALHAAGHKYDGHTGLLQHLTRAASSFMLLAGDQLSTIHVSTHVSLSDAIARCQGPRIIETIAAGHQHLKRLGRDRARIAVAGLNPHAGEDGLFGNQEATIIKPAIEQARAQGYDVSGPHPPDSIFLQAAQGKYDLVVAMYHDQGHIPTKLLAFDRTVNVSLGLPIDRTSVDHGTAFDIAWKGLASPENMVAALEYAFKLRNAAEGP